MKKFEKQTNRRLYVLWKTTVFSIIAHVYRHARALIGEELRQMTHILL